jgi:iron complex transport system substrate-binding protein
MQMRRIIMPVCPTVRHGAVSIMLALSVLLAPRGMAAHASLQATPSTITVVDDHHTRIVLHKVPRRLIALAANVTEILFALGLGPEVVGVSSYSTYPPAATKLPIVINYTTLNLEEILRLKPDLLVAAAIVPQSIIIKLRSAHLTVLVTDPHDLAGILHDIVLVGTATGVPGRARGLAARLQKRINAVETVVRRARTHPRVFYEIDSTLYTAGHGSFIDALITLAGGVNVAGTVMNPYPQLSAEKVIAADPQYIILSDARYGTTVASVAARPGWSRISAVRHHHVYPFNDDLASRPGPRIVLGLETLERLLHPELFH